MTLVVGDIPREPPGYQVRADLLAKLDQVGRGDPVVHVLTGTAGAGKTQVAAGYAWAGLANDWQVVAWINAGSVSTLLGDLATVADAVRLSEDGAGQPACDPDQAVRHRQAG